MKRFLLLLFCLFQFLAGFAQTSPTRLWQRVHGYDKLGFVSVIKRVNPSRFITSSGIYSSLAYLQEIQLMLQLY